MSPDPTTYQNLVQHIQSLQDVEKHLYANLETLPPGADANAEKQIIDKINNTSKARISLFETLHAMHGLIKDNVTLGQSDVHDKLTIIHDYETRLNELKAEMNRKRNLNINNLRLVEINTYYSQKYNAYYKIFRNLVLICVGLIIVAVLRQRYLISPKIANILGIIVIVVGLFFVVPKLIDLTMRNNLVFDEYDFGFNPEHPGDTNNLDKEIGNKLTSLEDEAKKYERDLILLASGECLGPGCCSEKGLKYDAKKKECIVETFISGQSTQQPGALLSDPTTMSKQLLNMDRTGSTYSID